MVGEHVERRWGYEVKIWAGVFGRGEEEGVVAEGGEELKCWLGRHVGQSLKCYRDDSVVSTRDV